METLWSYLLNPFLNAAGDNFKKFNTIVTFTYDRIKAKAGDAFFDELILDLESVYLSWQSLYTAWSSSTSAHKAATLLLANLFKDLSGDKIDDWDIKIQVVYKKDTPQYMNLLPNGRKPFQSGSHEQRIQAVADLVTAIGSDAALATLKTAIIAFQTTLTDAKSDQAAKLSATNTYSEQLSLVIKVIAKFMYLVLGKFMVHYYDNPTMIEPYFDLATIRSAAQVEFTKTVKQLKDANIAKRKLKITDQIKVVNDGPVAIIIYYAPEKNDPHTTYGVSIAAGEDETLQASDLGNLTTGNFLKAYNADSVNEAHFVLTIIK